MTPGEGTARYSLNIPLAMLTLVCQTPFAPCLLVGRGRLDQTNRHNVTGEGANRSAEAAKPLAGAAAEARLRAAGQAAFLKLYKADLARLQARTDLPKTARWIDSHCHLESILRRTWRGGDTEKIKYREPCLSLPELVSQWPDSLDGCICNCVFRRYLKPGCNIAEWGWLEANLHHFEPPSPISKRLWFTIGLHPHDAQNWDDAAEATVRRLALHPKCVAIGECGMDFFRHDQKTTDVQLRAFSAQAKLAVELGKALVIHSRLMAEDNEDRFLNVLHEILPRHHPVHVHCFSDSLKHALELCEHWPNLRIGFTGGITFKRKGLLQLHNRKLVQGLPLERLLIETDGPYMCPEPFRGYTAHPGHVHRVAETVAEWQGVGLGVVMDATRQSTRVVYGI